MSQVVIKAETPTIIKIEDGAPNPAKPPTTKTQGEARAHKRQLEQLNEDAKKLCSFDISTPFRSLQDAVDRLMPFHLLGGLEPDAADLEELQGVNHPELVISRSNLIAQQVNANTIEAMRRVEMLRQRVESSQQHYMGCPSQQHTLLPEDKYIIARAQLQEARDQLERERRKPAGYMTPERLEGETGEIVTGEGGEDQGPGRPSTGGATEMVQVELGVGAGGEGAADLKGDVLVVSENAEEESGAVGAGEEQDEGEGVLPEEGDVDEEEGEQGSEGVDVDSLGEAGEGEEGVELGEAEVGEGEEDEEDGGEGEQMEVEEGEELGEGEIGEEGVELGNNSWGTGAEEGEEEYGASEGVGGAVAGVEEEYEEVSSLSAEDEGQGVDGTEMEVEDTEMQGQEDENGE